MKKAFLLALGGVVAQNCQSRPVDNCGVDCQLFPGYCYRKNGVTPCNDTLASDCSVPQCYITGGPKLANSRSCSTCFSSCNTFLTNDTCSANSESCQWQPAYCVSPPPPVVPQPCLGTTQAACVAESNCFWISFDDNICGIPKTLNLCTPCNSSRYYGDGNARSAIYNNVGKTCTWAIVPPFTQAYTVTIHAAAQSADCPAFTAPNTIDDQLELTRVARENRFQTSDPFYDAPNITCTDAPKVCSQLAANSPDCSSANNCTVTAAYCYRKPGAPACNTADKTVCSGAECQTLSSSGITNARTCSTCGDKCRDYTSSQCAASASTCAWSPASCSAKKVCEADSSPRCVILPGCFWQTVEVTQCGVEVKIGQCSPCNGSFAASRSALFHNLNNTCSWQGYSDTVSLKIRALESSPSCTPYSSDTSNTPLTIAMRTGLWGNVEPFDGTPEIKCAVSSASSFLPHFAFLGLSLALMSY